MEHLIALYTEFEIQFLVALSFMLQLFLFVAGRVRRWSNNRFLRLCLWAVYLGADLAAVYALGYLSRRQDVTIERNKLTRTQPLAFFWAPFFLIHLGGQDTITAFAMEDNNLWLRHLLNLLTQVSLALYVFWKSIGKHSANLLVAGSFVFVAGIIKYGERTRSLRFGSIQSLESSDFESYTTKLPEGISGDVGVVRDALDSMPLVLHVLAERNMLDSRRKYMEKIEDPKQTIRMVRLQLGMIYDDLYTKSAVLRTWSGVIFRCISQASVITALVLFHASDRGTYSKADSAITYSLFVGYFLLEISSGFVSLMSPWTWAWLKVKKCDALASLWVFFCYDKECPRTMRWTNLIGQYNLYRWLFVSHPEPTRCTQRIMIVVRKLLVDLFRVKRKNIFFMSKLLDTEYVGVDCKILEGVAQEINLLACDVVNPKPNEWLKIGTMLKDVSCSLVSDFGLSIVWLHVATEIFLEKCDFSNAYIEANGSDSGIEEANNGTDADATSDLMEVCRKLSEYMMYLLVHHPSMLPLSISTAATVTRFHQIRDTQVWKDIRLEANKQTLKEVASMWTRLLVYAAGKSKAATHVAQLGGGGQLITLAWLVMAHCGFGDTRRTRLQLINTEAEARIVSDLRTQYAFHLHIEDQISSDNNNRSELDEQID